MTWTVAKRILGALRPPHRHPHTFLNPCTIRRQGRAFIKAHHNIRTEQLLNLHRPLWRQLVLGAVNVALKRDALFGHLAQISEAHHLKPATISQDRLVPIHKLMQATKVRNPLRRRAQHQVIGIAQQNIRTGRGHALRHHRLHRRRSANRHKRRRANIAARGVNNASTGLAVRGREVK